MAVVGWDGGAIVVGGSGITYFLAAGYVGWVGYAWYALMPAKSAVEIYISTFLNPVMGLPGRFAA